VDLQKITIPMLIIYAGEDHLMPLDESKALGGYIGSKDYTEMEFSGGHIGIYVSSRSQSTLPPAIASWIAERT